MLFSSTLKRSRRMLFFVQTFSIRFWFRCVIEIVEIFFLPGSTSVYDSRHKSIKSPQEASRGRKDRRKNFFADVAAKQSTVFASFLNWSEIATGSDVLVRLAWLRTLPHPLARIACFPLLILSSALSLPLSFSVLSQTLSPYCTRSSLSPLSHAPNRFPSNALSETVHRYTFVRTLPSSLSLSDTLHPSLWLSPSHPLSPSPY